MENNEREGVVPMDEEISAYSITKISIDKLVPYYRHPFNILDDDALKILSDDIEENGLINPIVVRKKVMSQYYEILSGHRRWTVAKRLGWDKIDARIVIVNDCRASNIVIRSNFSQRDKILPSEKAKAYQLRNETLKEEKYGGSHGGNETDRRICIELETEFNESKTSLFRYMRLNYLIEELLVMVDENKIILRVAENLSYFSENSQSVIYRYFYVDKKAKLDLNLVQQMRKLGREITEAVLDELTSTKKETKITPVRIINRYRKYYGNDEAAERKIFEILDAYFARLERQNRKDEDTKINTQQENGNSFEGANTRKHKHKKSRNFGDTKLQS